METLDGCLQRARGASGLIKLLSDTFIDRCEENDKIDTWKRKPEKFMNLIITNSKKKIYILRGTPTKIDTLVQKYS